MAAKTTTTSGLSFLTRIPKLVGPFLTRIPKLVGPFLTRIPKLVGPFLLFVVTGILHTTVKRVYMIPLIAEMSRHLSEMEEHTENSSAEHARILQETQQDATSLRIISIAVALVTLTIAFAKQIFAASSTTNSSDCFSLAELLREVTKWHNLKLALFNTAAVVTVSQLLPMALLGANFPTAMHYLGLLSVQGYLVLVAFLALFYLGMVAVASVGLTRKEFSVLVLATLLLPTLLIPVCAFGLLFLYTKQVMGLGLSLLSVYDLLQSLQDQLYLVASCVYCLGALH